MVKSIDVLGHPATQAERAAQAFFDTTSVGWVWPGVRVPNPLLVSQVTIASIMLLTHFSALWWHISRLPISSRIFDTFGSIGAIWSSILSMARISESASWPQLRHHDLQDVVISSALLTCVLPNIYYTAVLLVQIRHLSLPIAVSWLSKAGNNVLNIKCFVLPVIFLPWVFCSKYCRLNRYYQNLLQSFKKYLRLNKKSYVSFTERLDWIDREWMVSVVFICHMRFPGNIPTLQENGIGSMYFLRPNGLEILVLVNKAGIISMKQLSRNLLKKPSGMPE